jgi:putative ABC transport system permease protein
MGWRRAASHVCRRRRDRCTPYRLELETPWTGQQIDGGGVGLTLAIVFSTGSLAFTPRYALAIGGTVIGNAMTIATLAGRRFTESVKERWEEVEGWLALGAMRRQSTADLARGAVYSALIPSTDQTRTTGLVTLPGAFVGAVFGGISPLEAGRFQILVLASIMAAGSITAVMVIGTLAPIRVRPARLN